MKRALVVIMIGCMICVSMTGVVAYNATSFEADESTTFSVDGASATEVRPIEEAFRKIANIDEYSDEEEQCHPSQPVLGGNEVFGLWIRIVYNGNEVLEKVDIDPWMIRGKLTDPGYRTPITFNVDDDPEDDIETGFGFFSYGIDEGSVSHSAWATAFDFMQIHSGLDDQLGELEVWQEFHVNLALIKNKGLDKSTHANEVPISNPVTRLKNTWFGARLVQFMERMVGLRGAESFTPLQTFLNRFLTFSQKQQGEQWQTGRGDPAPLAASEDYIVTRVGFCSKAGQLIPIRYDKTFAVAKDNIFRPVIFQHEMNPYNIIGTDSNDISFGFLSYREGYEDPVYNVEFSVNFDPSVYLVTQFTPRSGRIYYYYHSASAKQTDITFYSNVLKGGDPDEEKEGSLSLTLSLEYVPNELVGPGKWMCFDIEALGDLDPLDGVIHYTASHEFDVAIIVSSSRFEEKIAVEGIPDTIDLSWHLGVDIDNGAMFLLNVDGYVELNMSDQLDKVVLYYPKSDPEDPDMPFINVISIPSNEKVGAYATLYVDSENFTNPANYVYGKVYRDYSANLEGIQMCLPYVEEPLIEVSEIPSYAAAQGKLEWNKLKGYAQVDRWSTGNPDPVSFYLSLDTFTISNVLEIGEGHIRGDVHLAEDGYLGFDTSEKMFGDFLQLSDSATGTSLTISVDEVAADNLWVDWGLDTSGGQLQVGNLGFSGFLNTLKDFQISMNLEGVNCNFDGSWDMGESGSFDIEFNQPDDVRLDFDLDDYSEDFDLHGHAILSNNLNFDMSWKWKQGENYLDPGYFKINENHNQPNLDALSIYFTYQDQYGADVTLTDAGIYVSCEWWRDGLIPYVWLVFDIYGELDFHLLWDETWYYNVEDW